MLNEADTSRIHVTPKNFATCCTDKQTSEQRAFTDGQIYKVDMPDYEAEGVHCAHSTLVSKPNVCDEQGRMCHVDQFTPERSLLTGEKLPRRWDTMSPLRYPGSKRKILPSVHQLIEGNIPKPELFVEPFCGGASIALGLLEMDAVERVLLSDFDPLVAAFWMEAANNADRLVEDMMNEPVTVERWDFWRTAKPRSTREMALKCLFLNRTTFSGIIGSTAGPIGGRAQTSEYGIGCRFHKEPLARRILNVKRLAEDGRILGVHHVCWQDAVRHAEAAAAAAAFPDKATLFYLDPPYIEKASRIYELPFTDQDHRTLARYLTQESEHRWILSYDEEPLVLDLYRRQSGVSEFSVTHHYTMRGIRRSPVPGREILFTNLPVDPTDTHHQTRKERRS